MKSLPGSMASDLLGGATTHCHCWLVTRRDGKLLGFTDHDDDIILISGLDVADGAAVIFEAASGFTASEMQTSLGLNVDNMDVEGALSSDKLKGVDLDAGLWDNASIRMWRVDWQDPSKRLLLLAGQIGEVSRGEKYFSAEMRSLSHALNQPFGRRYLKLCDAILGDERCKVDLTNPDFTVEGIVSAVQDRSNLQTTSLDIMGKSVGWFSKGQITWNSGLNVGLTMDIMQHYTGTGYAVISLWEEMPYDIQERDTFTLVKGCDKRIETCDTDFDNVINHRGFPRMPGNERLQYYARKGGDNDGGSLYGTDANSDYDPGNKSGPVLA